MDWRSSLTAQSRQEVIQKLIEVVRLAAPTQDHAKLSELAASTEQSIFEKSKSRQEYILLLQQKIANLQAKIAVIQKNQSPMASPAVSNQYHGHPSYMNQGMYSQSLPIKPQGHGLVPPVIAPKYPQMNGNVPVNLRNMVLNLQQQQAQNIQNSIKSQQTAKQALQAAQIAQKTLMGVQMQAAANKPIINMNSMGLSPSLQASVPIQPGVNIHAAMPSQASVAMQASTPSPAAPSSPASSAMSFPSLILNESQKSEVAEKLKQLLPFYQKIDLITSFLSTSDHSSSVNIQKLTQLKSLLTEQYKSIKQRIFLSPESLDSIHEFLLKMLQNVDEFRNSKIATTPKQSTVQTPTNPQKSSSQMENISNGFKYAVEQELLLKKSSKVDSANLREICRGDNDEWISELKMYGLEDMPSDHPLKNKVHDITHDYESLYGSAEPSQQKNISTPDAFSSMETAITELESLGFIITPLEDYKYFKVYLVKNLTAGWSMMLHIYDNLISDWQFLQVPSDSLDQEFLAKNSSILDKNLLKGKSIEMVQFLKFLK